ncbi:acetyltransferase, N-acetylglutamate synthase [Xenococcus sp. PCC 7305]|uniref:GNAT family N-acetyltransferase n=1 Tax=Xenococcus sp. PCC 7305 TaxID=102125 RepID=UPI0002AC1E90|nr:GNAT family N-acetyltransferase [Xenococcus sp. PCC 7305]ELS04603.1 acetyltransferase, N-acetylglutamate synthase [Xenococcus sp. PCC 7305]
MDSSQIQFCSDKSQIDLQQVQNLFVLGAFWAQDRTIEDIKIAVEHSDPVITVWDRDLLIGFARATSDVVYRAGIWDVVVHPDYRGRGLGGKLVETVLAHPKVNKVERVYLTTTNQKNFYKKIGFKQNSSTTMVLENARPVNLNSLLEQQAQR